MNMKRIFLLAALCLLLVGCVRGKTPAETLPAVEPSGSEAPAGLYDPDFPLARETAGALRCFPLGTCGTTSFFPMGDRILLLRGNDTGTTMTVLAGSDLCQQSGIRIDSPCFLYDESLQVSEKGLSYFDSLQRITIRLDTSLAQVQQIPAPEGLLGTPLLSADGSRLYYCTSTGIRVLDTASGISRVLNERTSRDITVSALLLNDTVLECDAFDDGTQSTLFFSTETGKLLGSTQYGSQVVSDSDRYYAVFHNGSFQEMQFGVLDGSAQALSLPKKETFLAYLPEQHAALSYFFDAGSGSLTLSRFDLNTGKRASQITLNQVSVPGQAYAAPGGKVYFSVFDEGRQEDVLCLWDCNSTPASDSSVYTGPFYTPEFPDLDGLARCQARAREISSRRGIRVLVWQDAVEVQPWDYSLEPEYLVPRILEELDDLDLRLSNYPDGFLDTLSDNFTGLSICLVRSITGTQAGESLETVAGLQYWDNASGFLALSTGQDTEYTLYHELCHMIDTQVISRTNAYDCWDNFNPSDFTYDNSYTANQSRDGSRYLTSGSEAFIDTYSMSFAKEDRARIMEYAMTPGHKELFRSSILQSKLKQMCIGIREAFGLENSRESYLWEQYLWEPLGGG